MPLNCCYFVDKAAAVGVAPALKYFGSILHCSAVFTQNLGQTRAALAVPLQFFLDALVVIKVDLQKNRLQLLDVRIFPFLHSNTPCVVIILHRGPFVYCPFLQGQSKLPDPNIYYRT